MSKLRLTNCTVDLDAARVQRGDERIRLTTREVALLRYLVAHVGEEVARQTLQVDVWGYAPDVMTRAVDATMNRLRAKIEVDASAPDHLLTVWGTGFRLVLPDAPIPAQTVPTLERPSDRFFGRERLLVQGLDVLQGGPTRMLTLHGPGGVGKTRLALELTDRLRDAGVEVVCCALASRDSAEGVRQAVASVLGVSLNEDATVAVALDGHGPMVLVLDNLEQIRDLGGLLQAWLRAAPALRLLVTSRVRLGVAGERVLELGGLDPTHARALFVDRGPHGLDAETLDDLLEQVDRLPLAIELAAGLADVVPVDELRQRLATSLDVQSARARDPRHTTLRQVVEGSWVLLDEPLRQALIGLSVFRGGFALADAEAVLGEHALEKVRALRSRSLIRRRTDGRLELYAAVATFVHEVGAEHIVHHQIRHLDWFAKQIGVRDLTGEGNLLHWLDRERDNLTTALQHGLETDLDRAVILARALRRLFAWRGPASEAQRVLSSVIDQLPTTDSRCGALRLSRAHARLQAGALDAAQTDLTVAADLAQQSNDVVLIGRVAAVQAHLFLVLDRTEDALLSIELGLNAARQVNDDAVEASLQGTLGWALTNAGQVETALEAYQHSRGLHLGTGNARGAALSLSRQGLLEAMVGSDGARLHLLQAMEENRRLGYRLQEAVCMGHLGNHALVEQDAPEALVWFEAAAERVSASGYSGMLSALDARNATALSVLGHHGDAMARAELAVDRLPGSSSEVQARWVAALVAAHGGRRVEARAALTLAGQRDPTQAGAIAAVVDGLLGVEGGRASALMLLGELSQSHGLTRWFHELRPWWRILQQ